MTGCQTTMCGVLSIAAVLLTAPAARTQTGAETFTGTATVKTSGGATASAPITIVIDRMMSQSEADQFTESVQDWWRRRAAEGARRCAPDRFRDAR